MTPQELITKWKTVELKWRSASQSHFNDPYLLLGVVDPVTADPKGTWLTFKKGPENPPAVGTVSWTQRA